MGKLGFFMKLPAYLVAVEKRTISLENISSGRSIINLPEKYISRSFSYYIFEFLLSLEAGKQMQLYIFYLKHNLRSINCHHPHFRRWTDRLAGYNTHMRSLGLSATFALPTAVSLLSSISHWLTPWICLEGSLLSIYSMDLACYSLPFTVCVFCAYL